MSGGSPLSVTPVSSKTVVATVDVERSRRTAEEAFAIPKGVDSTLTDVVDQITKLRALHAAPIMTALQEKFDALQTKLDQFMKRVETFKSYWLPHRQAQIDTRPYDDQLIPVRDLVRQTIADYFKRLSHDADDLFAPRAKRARLGDAGLSPAQFGHAERYRQGLTYYERKGDGHGPCTEEVSDPWECLFLSTAFLSSAISYFERQSPKMAATMRQLDALCQKIAEEEEKELNSCGFC